ncbi:hypothetical protein [Fusibacter ferrireducens]|uniref:SH3b domain-containing protein n=1 Tax=Fusibacter ferrireducens TaxID=2785058 RepID=A0ABR9ZWW4_9FIRM|nr:hypothetical protein [Fusibacter ferrireducens]MBF4694959.1 hypothetical protein [Fusibacter ferrireducens]
MKKAIVGILVLLMIVALYFYHSKNRSLQVNQEYILVYDVSANDEADYNYADYPKIMLNKGDRALVKSIEGHFVEIEVNGERGWINDWYITASKPVNLVSNEIKYVLDATILKPFPEEAAAFNYDEVIESGKVVVIQAEYEGWYCVQILRYSEPLYDNYWIRKDEVGIVDDEDIREGKIKLNAELLTLSGKTMSEKIESYIIVEAYNDEYLKFDAPGGIMGLIKISDFLPIKSYDEL